LAVVRADKLIVFELMSFVFFFLIVFDLLSLFFFDASWAVAGEGWVSADTGGGKWFESFSLYELWFR